MLSRIYAVFDLEPVPWGSGALVRCRFSRFVALWICDFSALGSLYFITILVTIKM
jgi:hypothetical protein